MVETYVFNVSKFTNETHYSLTKLLFSTPACKSRHVLMSADFESIIEDLLGGGEGQEKNSGLRTGDEHLEKQCSQELYFKNVNNLCFRSLLNRKKVTIAAKIKILCIIIIKSVHRLQPGYIYF